MNAKNRELFFGDDEDVVITLTDETGRDEDYLVVASFEIEELETEYFAVMSVDENGENQDGEILLLRYLEDEEGEAVIEPIEDEEEGEIASQAFSQLLKEGAIEGLGLDEDDDDEESGDDDDYLGDIGSIFPGVSIDK